MIVDKIDIVTALLFVVLLYILYLYPRVLRASVPPASVPRASIPRASVPLAPKRLASETRSAAVLYDLAWGKLWPHHGGKVYKRELGQVNTDDELYLDGGVDAIPDSLAYDCLEDIGKVMAALSITAGFLNVLIIREQYNLVHKMLERSDHKAFVIIGHPGIGKTTFLVYLLLYRLEQKLPTAVQLSDECYFIFDKHGACARELTADDSRLEKCWALSDSNGSVIDPCHAFQSQAQRVIQMTPPEPRRWKMWAKFCGAEIVVLDLPKVLEIGAVLKELRLEVGVTLSLVGKWGPAIRTVMAILKDPELVSQYHDAAAEASFALAMMPSSALVPSSVGPLPTRQSSSILFVRPGDDSTGTRTPLATCIIPTQFLSEFFDLHPKCPAPESALDLFGWLRGWHSLTHTFADWAPKVRMHFRMCTGGEVVHLYGIRKQEQMYLAPSNHILSGTKSSLVRAPAGQSFYWMPLAVNFPGIDGILGDDNGDVFALQATIAGDYVDPREGLERAWTVMSARAHCRWNFVLVCESQEDVEVLLDVFVPHLKDLRLGDQCPVKVWVCVLDY